MLISSVPVPVGHTFPSVPGSWLEPALYSQGQRPRRPQGVISRAHGLWWESAGQPQHWLPCEKCLLCSDLLRTFSYRFSPRPECLIRSQQLPGQAGNGSPPLGGDKGQGPARLHGRPSSGSGPGTCQPHISLPRLLPRGAVTFRSPLGRGHSFLTCNWAWHVSYIKPVWSVPW